jgi:hypothetical protein
MAIILGDPDRIGGPAARYRTGRPGSACLHRRVKIQQNWVVRNLEPLDVEVMLGKTHRVVAELVSELHLFRDLVQHLLV